MLDHTSIQPDNQRKKRIALLGIYHETNTFIQTRTVIDDFKNGYWLEGDAIRREYEGAHHEISGVIEVVDSCTDMELMPVFYASATPGGLISRDTYEHILEHLTGLLAKVLPVDGCIVVPHGAGVAQGYPDMDGYWLQVLRTMLGKEIPVTGTLDPHANVSPAMIDATNALIAYKTNPHIDQKQTGRDAAKLLVETLRGNIDPVQHLQQLPLAISIEQQYTSRDPCSSLLDYANQIAVDHKLLSVSMLLGFPYADVEEMGSSFIVVSDKQINEETTELNRYCLARLTEYVLAELESFNGDKKTIESILPILSGLQKPVLMLDMGDNVGGGAPGDSSFLLEVLEREGFSNIFICIHDPAAAAEAAKRSQGEVFQVQFGASRYAAEVELLQVSDGIFTESTPKHGGYVNYYMGVTAIVRTLQGNTIMLTTHRTPPYSLCQLTAFGLAPESFDIIVAKGVNAPIAAYGEVCPSVIQVDTPGVTQADMTLFEFKNRRDPMFPFERLVR